MDAVEAKRSATITKEQQVAVAGICAEWDCKT